MGQIRGGGTAGDSSFRKNPRTWMNTNQPKSGVRRPDPNANDARRAAILRRVGRYTKGVQ